MVENPCMRKKINGNLKGIPQSMPSALLLHWRALALLGALLLVVCYVTRPINCQPIPPLSHNESAKSEYFIKEIVLNKSFDSNNNESNKNIGQVSTTSSLTQEKIKLDKISQSSTSPQWTFNTLFTQQRDKGESIKNSVNSSSRSNFNVNHTTSSSLILLSRADRSVVGSNSSTGRRKRQRDLDRNERSANLSHITGATRKIQLYIKNRFLQILPDGTVNGTHDDTSDYSKYLFLVQNNRF